jgi:hypothetical protein
MTRALTLLCALGCYAAIGFSSLGAAETFGDWSTPLNIGLSLNTAANDEYAVLSRDELTIYFTSDRAGFGGLDLWFATRDSVHSLWSDPQNMGPLVNSEADDSLPFLSPNEHVLYFHSARVRPESCGGQGDIWMTRRRNKHSEWKHPTNLGCDPLGPNTSATETAPAFFEDPTTDQAWLFYGSNRTGVDFDVYASQLGRGWLSGSWNTRSRIQQPETRHPNLHTERRSGGVHHIQSDREPECEPRYLGRHQGHAVRYVVSAYEPGNASK